MNISMSFIAFFYHFWKVTTFSINYADVKCWCVVSARFIIVDENNILHVIAKLQLLYSFASNINVPLREGEREREREENLFYTKWTHHMSSGGFAIFIALPVLYWFHPHLRKEMP